jgi:hypothetical protein
VNGSTGAGGQTGNGLIVISWSGAAIPECNIGCTDPAACNYNPEAEINNGSCTYPDGCTDPLACNYELAASCDDGSCVYGGCNDASACNFNPNAACDDGTCIYFVDCAGVCGGNYISDECGNCYDPDAIGLDDELQFGFTGGMQTFTVPAGVNMIHVECRAAQGQGGSAGLGGIAAGDLMVNEGQIINVFVGGQNGYNGGGTGAPNRNGGGASDIRIDGISLADRVLVAGGGGGAGGAGIGGAGGGGAVCAEGAGGQGGVCQGCGPYAGSGGDGTCTVGGNGGISNGGFTSGGGGAGLTAGGSGSSGGGYGNAGTAGTLGQGGNFGFNAQYGICNSGAGGGGGYYGGGGSADGQCAAGGGGGGSSYIGGVLNGSVTAGVQSGNGLVIISWVGLQIPECFPGCTNPMADNFDPGANYDDGSCVIAGCTNPQAENYNVNATYDDGTCVIPGCTYMNASNYNQAATVDDGSCEFIVPGCTDEVACNYSDCALVDDGSCDYSCWGCTYLSANNYNELATRDDGSCVFDVVVQTCSSDINNDGSINSADLLDLLSDYGTNCP